MEYCDLEKIDNLRVSKPEVMRRSWLESSPMSEQDNFCEKHTDNDKNSQKISFSDNAETLYLGYFHTPPCVSFGNVAIGKPMTRVLRVCNTDDYKQNVKVERFPQKKGFFIKEKMFSVGPDCAVNLEITWNPVNLGRCREMTQFHVNGVYRLQAYMLGTAVSGRPEKRKKRRVFGKCKNENTSIIQQKSLKRAHYSDSPQAMKIFDPHSKDELIGAVGCQWDKDVENVCPTKTRPIVAFAHTPPPLESTAICRSNYVHQLDSVGRRQAGLMSSSFDEMSPIFTLTGINDTYSAHGNISAPDQTLRLCSGIVRSPLGVIPINEMVQAGPDVGVTPIAIAAPICLAAPGDDVSSFGREEDEFLRNLLRSRPELPAGVPDVSVKGNFQQNIERDPGNEPPVTLFVSDAQCNAAHGVMSVAEEFDSSGQPTRSKIPFDMSCSSHYFNTAYVHLCPSQTIAESVKSVMNTIWNDCLGENLNADIIRNRWVLGKNNDDDRNVSCESSVIATTHLTLCQPKACDNSDNCDSDQNIKRQTMVIRNKDGKNLRYPVIEESLERQLPVDVFLSDDMIIDPPLAFSTLIHGDGEKGYLLNEHVSEGVECDAINYSSLIGRKLPHAELTSSSKLHEYCSPHNMHTVCDDVKQFHEPGVMQPNSIFTDKDFCRTGLNMDTMTHSLIPLTEANHYYTERVEHHFTYCREQVFEAGFKEANYFYTNTCFCLNGFSEENLDNKRVAEFGYPATGAYTANHVDTSCVQFSECTDERDCAPFSPINMPQCGEVGFYKDRALKTKADCYSTDGEVGFYKDRALKTKADCCSTDGEVGLEDNGFRSEGLRGVNAVCAEGFSGNGNLDTISLSTIVSSPMPYSHKSTTNVFQSSSHYVNTGTCVTVTEPAGCVQFCHGSNSNGRGHLLSKGQLFTSSESTHLSTHRSFSLSRKPNPSGSPVFASGFTSGCMDAKGAANRKSSTPTSALKTPKIRRMHLDASESSSNASKLPIKQMRCREPIQQKACKATFARSRRPLPKQIPISKSTNTKLHVVKKVKTVIPRHPLSFASRNMYYDERWKEKQERGFVHWLNFVLTPSDDYAVSATRTKADAKMTSKAPMKATPHLAPTKEALSFRMYAARRRLNHLRRQSCRLFESEEVALVVCRLEHEVEQLRLCIRPDCMIHADTGIKKIILDMLLSYNPLWLRIGLETVFGEVLPLASNDDTQGMSRFILTHLLTSPHISASFAHSTVPHLYRHGYASAVAQHALKKLLVLVYFLDCAKRLRLVAHDPCLFCKDAEYKSSRSILVQFSIRCLSGEGDVTKHLGHLGYKLPHMQSILDEFDYSVSNLATSLRDGLRLARVVMLLSDDWSFATSLRTLTISRLQKIHNMELVFRHLTDRGLDFTVANGVITPRDITDGHREKTLAFLWKLVCHYQTVMVSSKDLRKEVDALELSLHVKLNSRRTIDCHDDRWLAAKRPSGLPVVMENAVLRLLLMWCQTVCLHYGVKVENFTVSFSDGRALCCLIHHYHPAMLPLHSIHWASTLTLRNRFHGDGADDSLSDSANDTDLSGSSSNGNFLGELDEKEYNRLLLNERANFDILYEKVLELGGIPLMLRTSDMSKTIPDERVVVTFVMYLCSRLMDLRGDSQAASVIQVAWRRYQLQKVLFLQQRKMAACLVIQRAWRRHSSGVVASGTNMDTEGTEPSGCHVMEGKELSARHRTICVHNPAALSIQRWWRAVLTRQHFRRTRAAVLVVQRHLRRYWRRCQMRVHCLQVCQAAVSIQTVFRATHQRRAFLGQREAAILIQTTVRRVLAQKRCHALRRAVRQVQSVFRARLSRASLRSSLPALVGTAGHVRTSCSVCYDSELSRSLMCRESAVVNANSCFLLHRLTNAVVAIQSRWRGVLAKRRVGQMREVVEMLLQYQQSFDTFQCVLVELKQRWLAAITIQKVWRGWKCRKWFARVRGVFIGQHIVRRMCSDSSAYRRWMPSTVLLQRCLWVHGVFGLLGHDFQHLSRAAVVCQSYWNRFHRCKGAIIDVISGPVCCRCCADRMHSDNELGSASDHAQRGTALLLCCTATGQMAAEGGWEILRQGWVNHFTQCHVDDQISLTVVILQPHGRSIFRWQPIKMASFRYRYPAVVTEHFCRVLLSTLRFRRQDVVFAIRLCPEDCNPVHRFRQRQPDAPPHQCCILDHSFMPSLDSSLIHVQPSGWSCLGSWPRMSNEGATSVVQRLRVGICCSQHQQLASAIMQKADCSYKICLRCSTVLRHIIILQTAVRCHLHWMRCRRLSCSAIIIQRWARRTLTFRVQQCTGDDDMRRMSLPEDKFRFLDGRENEKHGLFVARIQTACRMVAARQSFMRMKTAALAMQTTFRCHEAVRDLRSRMTAVIRIQRCVRLFLLLKHCLIFDYVNCQHALTICRSLGCYHMDRRNAALIIQRAFRNHLQRAVWHHAALTIQRAFRRHHQQQAVRHHAALTIKRTFRLRLQQKAARHHAALTIQCACWHHLQKAVRHHAALTIQRAFRRHHEQLAVRHHATLTIQRAFRHLLQQMAARHNAALTIQRAFRHHLQQQAVRHHAALTIQRAFMRHHEQLAVRHDAALTIQRAFRHCLQQMAARHNAALTIQRAFRRHRQQQAVRYHAALTIQRTFRRHLQQRAVWHHAALTIQRTFRRHLQQRAVWHHATLTIQRAFRRHHQQQAVRHHATLTIQRAFRHCLQQKAARHHAALTIQRAFRRHHQQQAVRHHAALTIQCAFRHRLQQKAVRHHTALTIQHACRHHLQQKAVRHHAALTIKRAFRHHLQQMAARHHAALTIQRAFMHLLQQQAVSHHSALTIQRAFRHRLQQQAVRHHAALTIQRAFRHRLQQKAARHHAALTIQRAFMRHHQQQTVGHHAALTIQRAFRHLLQQQAVRHHAALTIQRAFRHRLQQKAVRHRLQQKAVRHRLQQKAVRHHAALTIQRACRHHSQKKAVRHHAALTIQRSFRHCLQQKAARHHAAVTIQHAFVRHSQKKTVRHHAALTIQRAFRRHHQQQAVRHHATLTIQRAFRKHLQQQAVRHHATLTIQRAFRHHLQQKAVRHHAALTIQHACWCHLQQKAVRHHTALTIQRACRHHRQQKAVRHNAALTIQRAFRRHRQQQAVRHRAALTIQRTFRRHLQQRAVRHHATLTIQRAFRHHLKQMAVRHHAALTIQRAFRHCLQHKADRHHAALTIQRACRHHLQQKAGRHHAAMTIQHACCRHLLQKAVTHHAALTIQRGFRHYLLRQAVRHYAALTIQCAFRRHRQQQAARHHATLTIQRTFRRHRQQQAVRHHAALTIQRAFRHHLQQKAVRNHAALTIQHGFRRHLQQQAVCHHAALTIQRTFRRHHQQQAVRHHATLTIQRAFRKHLQQQAVRHHATLTIQRAFRHHLQQKAVRHHAALTIQHACWRHLQQKAVRHHTALTIQRACRHHRQQKAVRHNAALTIQRAFRRHRQQQAVRHRAALTIQRTFRRHLQQRAVRHHATLTIQRAFRHHLKQMAVRHHAALTIQRAFRHCLQHKADRHHAALTIQRACRHHLQQKAGRHHAAMTIQHACCRHLLQKAVTHHAALTIQRGFRHYLLRQAVRHHAALTIQCAFRRHRQQQAARHHATLTIQRTFRRHRQQQAVRHHAALTIQRAFRHHLQQKAVRNHAALTIQHGFRRHLQQQAVCHHAALTIQRTFRRHHQQQAVRHHATLTIQRAFRKHLQQQAVRHHATLTIQRAFRKHLQQQAVRHHAALTIQQAFRHILQQNAARHLAAMTIQHAFRHHAALTIQRACRRHFLQKAVRHHAALTIQRACRRHLQLLAVRHHAAMTIQRAFRKHLQQKAVRHNAALTIQCAFRRHRQQQAVSHHAALTIQRTFRRHLQQRAVWHHATLTIQRAFRHHLKQMAVRHLAALTIQRACRRHFLQKAVRHHAALTIQRACRRHLQLLAVRHHAAMTIQCACRHHLQQKAVRHHAAMTIQHACCHHLLQKAVMHHAALTIQRGFRHHLRQAVRHHAALTIQCAFRRHRQQQAARHHAALTIQRTFRRHRQQQAVMHNAALTIQRTFRHHLQQKAVRHNAALTIQRAFRHHLQQKAVRNHAALTIQHGFRRHLQQVAVRHTAALTIQRAFRHHLQQKAVRNHAALTIQHGFRRHLQQVAVRHTAALTIQRAFRHHLQQKAVRNHAALTIQHGFRRHLQQQAVCHHAALTIQRTFRRHRHQQAVRHHTALTIQRAFRRHHQQQAVRHHATLTIQRAFRKQQAVRHHTALTIHHGFSCYIHRCASSAKLAHSASFERQDQAGSVVQMQYSVSLQSQDSIQPSVSRCLSTQASTGINSTVDLSHGADFLREHSQSGTPSFPQDVHGDSEARTVVIEDRAARIIQAAFKRLRLRREMKHITSMIIKVQALWRGRQVRRQARGRRIVAVRLRVEEANKRATESDKLGNRTACALEFLLHHKQLSYILDALMHLDASTRLSWKCCERLAEVNAVGTIIRLILSCNRSLPHMELIKYSVSILLNLAKYEATVDAVYSADDVISTLVDLLSIYREKGSSIFSRACLLLAVLGSTNQRRKEIRSDPRNVSKLQSIHLLLFRKKRKQAARQRATSSSSSFNTTLPPRLTHGHRDVRVQPAWMLRRDSMGDIEDPTDALTYLLNTLRIGLK